MIGSISKHIGLFLLTLIFSTSLFAQGQRHSEEYHWKPELEKVRVISYNILAALGDEKREDKLISWLNIQDAEVIGFQELCGLTQEEFSGHAKKWGHPYAVILKENGYPVGISSKKPIVVKNKFVDGFWHGMLHVVTYGIDFMIIHLSPSSPDSRLEEANKIVDYIQTEKLAKLVLMGDFNAHSPMDADYLENNAISLSYLDYYPLSRFLSGKLIDPMQKFIEVENRMTYPTHLLMGVSKQSYHHKKRLERIDFILASIDVMQNVVDAYVFNGSEANYISDHYPLAIDLVLKK